MSLVLFFFFNDTATTEIYTLSLHDALPIYPEEGPLAFAWDLDGDGTFETDTGTQRTANRSFPAAGTFVVRVRVTDEEGASTEAQRTVTVSEPTGGGTTGGTTSGTTGEPTTQIGRASCRGRVE